MAAQATGQATRTEGAAGVKVITGRENVRPEPADHHRLLVGQVQYQHVTPRYRGKLGGGRNEYSRHGGPIIRKAAVAGILRPFM